MELTDAIINDVITSLETKAQAIEDGMYGREDEPGDDEAWADDLREAAEMLRIRDWRLSPQRLEEIECLFDIEEEVAVALVERSEEA